MSGQRNFPFKSSLNTSTLIPFQLDIKQQVLVAAEAGYEGIELWMRDIDSYVASGGSLRQLRQFIRDTGVEAVNAIAFFKWADADKETRERGFEQAEREMSMLAEIGCSAVAAPPFGTVETVSLDEMAERYFRLAQIGHQTGVEPYLEFWGRAKRLSRLSEALYVAVESGVDDTKLLLDPFHMYTGGSRIESIGYMDGRHIGIVHVNDYPAYPAREVITDKERVFPGDGVGPNGLLARSLNKAGYNGYLSLELFIPSYGSKSAVEAAEEGLMKMKKAYSLE
jgi:2-keto-myo-inositol isomerase